MSRFRSFTFTHNGYTDESVAQYEQMECKYIIVAKETGASGNKHLQGYIEYDSACTLSAAIKRLKPAHVEVRRGTPEQAANYCKKGSQPHDQWTEQGTSGPDYGKDVDIAIERGELGPGQGKRSDLEVIAERVKEGSSSRAIADEFPESYIRFHKGISALIRTRMTPRDATRPPYIEWRYGLAGRGKSSYVMKEHNGNVFIKDSTKWWQGYTQQEAILVDDFDGEWPFRNFLRFLDVYPYQGEVKGEDSIDINSPFIYITCEYPPSHFWRGNELEQVTSRLTKIVEVTGPNYRLLKKQRTEEPKSA